MEFNVDDYLNETAAMRSDMEKLQKLQHERSSDMLDDAFKRFFEATPDIVTVTWRQYTPYFNDGEECTFSVHDIYYAIGKDAPDIDDVDGYENYGFEEIDVELYQKLLTEYRGILDGSIIVPEEKRKKYPYLKFFGSGDYFSRKTVELNRDNLIRLIEDMLASVARYDEQKHLFASRDQDIKAFVSIEKLIDSIDPEMMREMFGDHIKVMITRDGIKTSEYDHE